MDFIVRFRAGVALFILKIHYLETPQFQFLSELYLFKALPNSRSILLLQNACSNGLYSEKNLFHFLYATPEKQERTISERAKFTRLIYRVLKSQETISVGKIPFTTHCKLIDLSCCDKYH